ncbi:hypothetical protein GCM10007989_19720 [Devosia pacifica]|uniref:N-acetyltransferase domain-containing protein n=1 Tax=Devosia pacifica TaxID=1335967 RepID=A0A918S6M8_9HYPH|nr:GNAT family N-acetyltransferase [Devosia pacifica]GHA24128.1 hypothetical protein GCM10007989_19720 [Devosia pacifica]
MTQVRVRNAVFDDCAALADMRLRSIARLCSPDHSGNAAAIEAWAGDSGPSKFVEMLDHPEVTLLIAEIEGKRAGLGSSLRDTVTLNYVDPDFRFMGVSKAIMSALEADMVAHGVSKARLFSTRTALPFYLSIGWTITGEGTPKQGTPMSKQLAPPA